MTDIRWQQRFANFQRAFLLLDEAMTYQLSQLSQLEKEGIIQRFEYTFELAWKVLKDKMEYDGLILNQLSPKAVIRQAAQARYIDNAELWLAMISDKNLMRHTYDFSRFESVILAIKQSYLPVLNQLYIALLTELTHE